MTRELHITAANPLSWFVCLQDGSHAGSSGTSHRLRPHPVGERSESGCWRQKGLHCITPSCMCISFSVLIVYYVNEEYVPLQLMLRVCLFSLTSHLLSSACRPCWAAMTVYLLCWNTGRLLCVETLRDERRCTSRPPVAIRSSSTVC